MSRAGEEALRLVVGAESGRIDAGLLRGRDWVVRASSDGNAVEGLAGLLCDTFRTAGAGPLEADEWIYSGGPGSLLALRTVAMTLETWAALADCARIRVRRYSGLVWTARHLARARPGADFLLLSPWRRGVWHAIAPGETLPGEDDIAVIEGEPDPGEGRRILCLGARPGNPLPSGSTRVELPPLEALADELDRPGFLRDTERAEPLQSGTTRYKRWEPRPHSAP